MAQVKPQGAAEGWIGRNKKEKKKRWLLKDCRVNLGRRDVDEGEVFSPSQRNSEWIQQAVIEQCKNLPKERLKRSVDLEIVSALETHTHSHTHIDLMVLSAKHYSMPFFVFF